VSKDELSFPENSVADAALVLGSEMIWNCYSSTDGCVHQAQQLLPTVN
jgi:hypothetical protein